MPAPRTESLADLPQLLTQFMGLTPVTDARLVGALHKLHVGKGRQIVDLLRRLKRQLKIQLRRAMHAQKTEEDGDRSVGFGQLRGLAGLLGKIQSVKRSVDRLEYRACVVVDLDQPRESPARRKKVAPLVR